MIQVRRRQPTRSHCSEPISSIPELRRNTRRLKQHWKQVSKKGKDSTYSITEHRVPEMIAVLGSQPAGDVSHKPGGRLPLLFARPAVTAATLKRAATNFAAW